MTTVVITGSTGYMGSRLAVRLAGRGHDVRALVREGSRSKAPPGARVVVGDALDASTWASSVPRGATLVHMVGVAHPSPRKAAEFTSVDLASIRASCEAAVRACAGHLVYVSVAHPAPAMKAYVAARVAGEEAVRATGLPATILRPWYVLGPGHWWPVLLVPAYAACELLPATREAARRLGLVTLPQMLRALERSVEAPPEGVRVLEVPEIRRTPRR